MREGILGIHHITALAGVAQENIDFYVNVLGLRMVKQTVNFDAPDVYHFYYGDGFGNPGTILTFFPFGNGPKGHSGVGQATAISFSIPKQSLGYWMHRLAEYRVSFEGPSVHSTNSKILAFSDPDGITLELVAHDDASERPGYSDGPVPEEHAIRGFYNVTMTVTRLEGTSNLLTKVMGFRLVDETEHHLRYEVGVGGAGAILDVVMNENGNRARNSIGTVHHIAWRVANEDELVHWQTKLMEAGMHVTEVKDRSYFKSVYFREPGGVLFELATDPPGFSIDEPIEKLGSTLRLPDWLESRRSSLEAELPQIHVPSFGK